MSRRIEIELTSDRGDGSWTWRAAGARQPRGVLAGTLLPAGAKAGEVLRAEVETDIEGTTVISVAAGPARVRSEPERIEIVGTKPVDEEQLVTTQLARPLREDGGGRRDRKDRPPRRDGEGGGRPGGPRGDRPPRRDGAGERPPGTGHGTRPAAAASGAGGDRASGSGGARRAGGGGESHERRPPREAREPRERRERRPAPPQLPERPKPKRLRAGRVHRKAVLAELLPEQQPIAEQVLKGGIPAVRQAIDAENEKRAAAGEPPINATELLGVAEHLLPRLRTADWRDRAEAALNEAGDLDLRDLRSVVVASDVAARDDETRALASDLRKKLEERVEAEHAAWLEDLGLALGAGRIVRALRLSSRPPKAGTMLPLELRTQLTTAAGAALTADVGADRWAAVLDATAFAPVRTEVKPASVPETPGDDLLAAVRKYASRVPSVAAAFGIEVSAPPRPTGRAMRPPKPPRRPGTVPVPPRPAPPTAIGAPVGAQAAPAAVEPDATAPPPPADVVPAGAAEPAAPTPEPVQPSVTAAPSAPVEAVVPEVGPEPDPEPATTPVADAGVAEAATPVEESSVLAEPSALPPTTPIEQASELAEPAPEQSVVEPEVEPVVKPPTEVTGMPEAATPVPASDAGDDEVAAAALEAAPDVDEISDGEPAG